MIVRPSSTALLVALLLAAAALAAGCGGDEERTGLLSASRAEQLRAGLDDVAEAVQDGSCTRVDEELGGLRNQLDRLPQSTDPDLQDRLEEGVSHLEDIAPIECDDQDTDTQTDTQPETEPEAIPDVVPEEPTETEPPAETTPEPTPTTPPEDAEGGAGDEETPGNGNGNGGVPPGQDSGGLEAPG